MSSQQQLDVGNKSLPKPVPPGHFVQFYESEAFLELSVSRFLGEGLKDGESVVIIASAPRRRAFEDALEQQGFDLARAKELGRFIALDAEETLAMISVGGVPNEQRFDQIVVPVIERAAAAASHARVRAYGEMVDLLWRQGRTDAAIHLEEIWNDILELHDVRLLCAYVMGSFYKQVDLHGVCSTHAHVLPTEHGAMSTEIEQRNEHERALRAALREVRFAEHRARELEQAARGGEQKLKMIADALPALVADVDSSYRYTFVNHSYQRWFGVAPETCVGKTLTEILGQAAFEQVKPFADRALRGETVTFQSQLNYERGGARHIEATYVPRRTADGSIDGFVSLVHDISDRKRLEDDRASALRRTERLLSITAGIADAVTADQVNAAIVDQTAAATGASTAGLWLVDADGQTASLVREVGYLPGSMEKYGKLPLSTRNIPALDVLHTGESMWIESPKELVERYPALAGSVTLARDYRVACLPVSCNGRTSGVLALTFENAPALSSDERGFLQLVARYCGQALERLRLLSSERASRAAAEAAAIRKTWLSRASQELATAVAGSEDVERVLQSIAAAAIEAYADACGIVRKNAAGALEVVALAHKDAGAARDAHDLLRKDPVTRLCRDAMLINDSLDLLVGDSPYKAWVERYQPTSMVASPLRTRDGAFGMIVVLRGEGHPRFSHDDRRLLEAIAQQTGSAIETLRLHEENRAARERIEQEHTRTVLLHALAGRVISAANIGEVYEAVLDTLEQALDADRGAVLVYDHDGVMRFRASRGLSDEYRRAVEGHSPWARDAKDPQPVYVDDAPAAPALSGFRELFARERIGALGFFPLVAEGRLVGKFMLYYDEPRALDQRDLDTGVAIANHVATAVLRFAAQEERERLIAELEQTVRFHEMFTGMLGHDLRNPLAAIMTAGQLALKKRESDRLLKPLTRIVSSGDRMARMIDQLLDFTRVRLGGGIPLEPVQTDIIPLLRQVLDELDDTHPDWSLRLSHMGDCGGIWDRDRLGQVFSNLVGNAVRHGIPEHGVQVRVDGTDATLVRIDVHNMGAVPDPLVAKIFDPMTGGDRRRDKSQGLGLGLYITRQIVKAHGGDVTLHSSEASGTTFTVLLPRASTPGRTDSE